MISLIASFKVLNVVIHDPNIFFWIATFIADAPVLNPKGIKTLLGNGLSTLFSKGKSVFSNSSKSLPKNHPYCPILYNWVFDNLILAGEPFSKALKTSKPAY